MNQPSAKARFDIDRALLAGQEGRAVKTYRDDVGGGIGDAIAFVEARREQLRTDRPHAFRAGAATGWRPLRGLWVVLLALLVPTLFLLPFELSYEGIERALGRLDPLVEELFEKASEMARSGDPEPPEAPFEAPPGEAAGTTAPAPVPVADEPDEAAASLAAAMREASRPAVDEEPPSTSRPRPPRVVPAKAAEGPLPLLTASPRGLTIDLYRHFRYEPRGFPFNLPTGQRALTLAARSPERVTREPRYRGTPYYTAVPLGDGPHAPLTVVVEQAPDRWRIHVDRDLNRDLADDGPPVEVDRGDGKGFGVALDLNVPTEGMETTRPYRVWLFIRKSGDGWRAAFYARCHYAARLRLGGEIYTAVAFEQHDQDGLFADDGLWIDLDRNGKLEEGEHFSDGEPIAVGGTRYLLRLAYR